MISYRKDALIIDKDNSKRKDFLTAKDVSKLILLDENTLNLYTALVRRSDFSGIFSNFIYVKGKRISKYIEKILEELPEKYKKKRHLLLRNKIREYTKRKRLDPFVFKDWLEKKEYPLIFLRVLSLLLNEWSGLPSKKILAKMLLKVDYYTSSLKERKVKLPIKLNDVLTEEIAYFVGCSVGDGGFTDKYIWRITCGEVENPREAKEFLEELKNFLQRKFMANPKMIKEKNKYRVYVQSKGFCRFLNFFFDIPYHKKAESRLIKSTVFKLSEKRKKLSCLFWRGLFDTDGSIDKKTNKLALEMESKRLVSDCRKELKRLSINSNMLIRDRELHGNTYRMYSISIPSKSLRNFAVNIGFSYNKKRERLISHLKKGPSHFIFKGVNKDSIYNGYFDLTRLKGIRIFLSNRRKETIKSLLGSSSKAELFSNLRKSQFKIQRRRSKVLKMPIRPKEEFEDYLKNLHPHGRNFVSLTGRDKDMAQVNQFLQSEFGLTLSKASDGRIRLSSSLLNEFLKTFYRYEPAWEAMNERELKKLSKKLEGPFTCSSFS